MRNRFYPNKNVPYFLHRIFLIFTLLSGLLILTGSVHAQRHSSSSINAAVKHQQIPYLRQVVQAEQGGILAVNNLKLRFPARFASQDVVISYHLLSDNDTPVLSTVDTVFELTAKQAVAVENLKKAVTSGMLVEHLERPVTLEFALPSLPTHQLKSLILYHFDVATQQWQAIDSQLGKDNQHLVASLKELGRFALTANEPASHTVLAPQVPSIIDDSDGPPAFVPDGVTIPPQPAFWGQVGSGYNGDALYTGNSIDNQPRNWATWSVFSGLTGNYEVWATIPPMPPHQPLTQGATYEVTHAGGVTPVVIDQAANAGGVISLGTFTFAGSGSVYLDDVVPEQGDFFLSHIVFDAISFGVPFDPNLDIVPPNIEDVKSFTNAGTFIIQATITDSGSGVDPSNVFIFFDGQFYPMQAGANDVYSAALPYAIGGNLEYYIVAYDLAGNEAIWSSTRGYIIRGGLPHLNGFPAGAIFNCKDINGFRHTQPASCDSGIKSQSQYAGDPVNTQNGNFIERQKLVTIPGRPEIDLYLTYNSQGGRESIFGQNWTHSYNYHLLVMDNVHFQGAFVQYPDGKAITFNGPTFTPPPGYYERLTATSSGYELTFTDLSKALFDNEGELVRLEDANGNGLDFTYGARTPYTLLSQVMTITADGGRSLNLSYNDNGLVEQITAPEGKTLTFDYNETGDLTTFVDGRGNSTYFSYDDHNITTKVSPEGHSYFVNTYDTERRVATQIIGANFAQTYTYNTNQTVVTDANGHPTTYIYNAQALLTQLTDARGNSVHYEFTPERQISVMIDQEEERYEYDYDARGNRTYEKDPLGFEIIRVYDQQFSKPTFEQYKEADHTTEWVYDGQGNLREIINAKGDNRTFTYNSLGQLTEETDFNGNPTSYDYNTFGDVETITDALLQIQTFTYDGLGRLLSVNNPRGFIYTYTYDGNDNLLTVDGPLGYHLTYGYDANDNLISEIDANGGTITYDYDTSENLVAVHNQLSFTTEYSHGLMNEILTETDAEGRITTYTYDPTYNIATVTEATGTVDEVVTHFEYNGRHQVSITTDPENRITTYNYDALGRLTKEIRNTTSLPPDSENNVTTTYAYSPSGALVSVKDPNGNITAYVLDELDQVEEVIDAENQVTQYTYDAQGNVTSVTNPRLFTTTNHYDVLNRMDYSTDASGGQTLFDYDANSNLVMVTDANGVVTKFVYDELDRRTARIRNFIDGGGSDSQANVTTLYEYDLHGNLTTITNPRGFGTHFVYDAAHRNTDIIDALTHTTHFAYDRVNNLLTVTDRNNHAITYGHDSLNRVVTSSNAENHVEQYTYDDVGNLVQLINRRGKVFGYSYDPLNRLQVATDPYLKTKLYNYDAVGNLLTLTDENGHDDNFIYDQIYRLRQEIDAENYITEYQYDANSNIVKLIDGEGNATLFVYDELDRLTDKTNTELETEQYEYDALTNMTLLREADGTEHQYNFDPLYRLASVVNNFKVGQPSSPDTNVTTAYQYDANSNMTSISDLHIPVKTITHSGGWRSPIPGDGDHAKADNAG